MPPRPRRINTHHSPRRRPLPLLPTDTAFGEDMRALPSPSSRGSIDSAPDARIPPHERHIQSPRSTGLSSQPSHITSGTMALPESAGPSSERFETELNTRSITRQLDGLESKTSQKKVQIMESIATEIGATFMGIQQHIDAGTLQGHETDAIETVTDIINGTDGNRRRMLERQVRRLRKERNWTLRRHLGRPNPGVLSDVLPRLEEENRRLQEENEWWRSRTEGLRLERDSLLNRLQAKESDIAPPTEAEEDGEPEERTQAETEG